MTVKTLESMDGARPMATEISVLAKLMCTAAPAVVDLTAPKKKYAMTNSTRASNGPA